jgi:hypothetical protein
VNIEGWDPELGPMIAIPEPFWVRTPRTLFRWRPACYGCRKTFPTRERWEQHWLTEHLPKQQQADQFGIDP